MISKRSLLKVIFASVIVVIGLVYWYMADQRTSPVQEVEKAVETAQ